MNTYSVRLASIVSAAHSPFCDEANSQSEPRSTCTRDDVIVQTMRNPTSVRGPWHANTAVGRCRWQKSRNLLRRSLTAEDPKKMPRRLGRGHPMHRLGR
jgi:hypothetical protein